MEGPEWHSRAMMAVRDGRIVWREDDISLSGHLAAAPDGTVFQKGTRPGSGPDDPEGVGYPVDGDRRLLHIRRDYTMSELLLPVNAAGYGRLAIGPGGHVYSSGQGTLIATCRAERVLWELRMIGRPGPGNQVEWGEVTIDHVGQVHAVGVFVKMGTSWTSRALTISAEGEVLSSYPSEPDDQSWAVFGPYREGLYGVREQVGDQVRFGVMEDMELIWWTEFVPFSIAAPTTSRLGVDGAVWVQSPEELFRYSSPNIAQPFGEDFGVGLFIGGIHSTSDPGVVLSTLHEEGRAVIAALDERADVLWRIRSEDSDLATDERLFALEHDGGAYFAGSWIFALQTDALPPERGTCFNAGCNARHNNWMSSP